MYLLQHLEMKESHEIKAQVDPFEKLVKSHHKILFKQSIIYFNTLHQRAIKLVQNTNVLPLKYFAQYKILPYSLLYYHCNLIILSPEVISFVLANTTTFIIQGASSMMAPVLLTLQSGLMAMDIQCDGLCSLPYTQT